MINNSSFKTGFEKKASKKKVVENFTRHIVKDRDSQKKVLKGLKEGVESEGPLSFVASIPSYFAGKVVGKKKIDDAAWKYISKPSLSADTSLGNTLSKIPVVGGLFKVKEKIPWGKKGLYKEIVRPSALGPLVKARNIAVPIVAGIGIDKGIRDISDKIKNRNTSQSPQEGVTMDKDLQKLSSVLEPELREKVASTMLRLHADNKEHEKRAYATKLIFKQAELGVAPLPNTYHEFEQKLASLIRQDMAIVEKAMELNSGEVKIGELTGSDHNSFDAASTFQAEVLG